MKRFTCILIVLLLMFSMCACERLNKEDTAVFYYPRYTYTYNSSDSVIASEARSTEGYLAISKLLQYYLQGPEDVNLVNPFPQDLVIHSVRNEGTALNVVLSDHMADLTDLQLVLACICLAKTAVGITNASSVRISCDTELLAGKNYIEIDDSMVLLEDVIPASTEDTK